MKTLLKRYGIFAVLTLATAVLLTNCINPVDTSNLGDSAGRSGTSIVRLSLGNNDARTIMPTTNLTNFNTFLVQIHEITGGTAGGTDGTNGTAVTIPASPGNSFATSGALAGAGFPLDVGTMYRFTVNAYLEASATGSEVVVATGRSVNIMVQNTNSTPFPIALVPITSGGGTGHFTWAITIGGSDTGTLDVNAAGFTSTTNMSSSGTGVELPAGYYTVTLVRERDGIQDTVTPALHIFQGMTSNWTQTFGALQDNRITVVYNDTDGLGGITTITTYEHGDLIDFNDDGTDDPIHDDPTENEFDGWWTEDGTTSWGDEVEDGDRLVRSSTTWGPQTMNLYAKWDEILTSSNVNVTVSYTSGDPAASVTPSSVTTTQTALQTTPLEINLSGGGDGITLSQTQWWYKGAQIHTGENFSMGISGNYDQLGQHWFTLRWEVSTGVFVSRLFAVTVN